MSTRTTSTKVQGNLHPSDQYFLDKFSSHNFYQTGPFLRNTNTPRDIRGKEKIVERTWLNKLDQADTFEKTKPQKNVSFADTAHVGGLKTYSIKNFGGPSVLNEKITTTLIPTERKTKKQLRLSKSNPKLKTNYMHV